MHDICLLCQTIGIVVSPFSSSCSHLKASLYQVLQNFPAFHISHRHIRESRFAAVGYG